MRAFLKRRWFLLSCAVVLLACSMIDFFWSSPINELLASAFGERPQVKGLCGGFIGCEYHRSPQKITVFGHGGPVEVQIPDGNELHSSLHAPELGNWPRLMFTSVTDFSMLIPLWLPLTAILGWLVIYELRWREKRAKAGEM